MIGDAGLDPFHNGVANRLGGREDLSAELRPVVPAECNGVVSSRSQESAEASKGLVENRDHVRIERGVALVMGTGLVRPGGDAKSLLGIAALIRANPCVSATRGAGVRSTVVVLEEFALVVVEQEQGSGVLGLVDHPGEVALTSRSLELALDHSNGRHGEEVTNGVLPGVRLWRFSRRVCCR